MIERQFESLVRVVQSDEGLEFHSFEKWMVKFWYWTSFHLSPHTYEQNGPVKSGLRTAVECALVFLFLDVVPIK